MYKIVGKLIKRLSDEIYFPLVDGNSDYEKYKEWLKEENSPEPEFTEEELLSRSQSEFRQARDILLSKVDIDINKAEDNGINSVSLRQYRQALRDSTVAWVLPNGGDYGL